jgi:hypothetical protein
MIIIKVILIERRVRALLNSSMFTSIVINILDSYLWKLYLIDEELKVFYKSSIINTKITDGKGLSKSKSFITDYSLSMIERNLKYIFYNSICLRINKTRLKFRVKFRCVFESISNIYYLLTFFVTLAKH